MKKYVNDLVSVIVPVYNSEKYIEDTLNSALKQTYENIEIILVDDVSKDKSARIISEYKAEHPEIIYYLQEKNMGAGFARNKALELAKGRYVAFLDSDDIWLPDKIERQIKLMTKTNSPFCYTAIEMIDGNNKLIKPKRNIKETCNYKYLLYNTQIATSSVVVDRKQLGDFRMHIRRGGQDYATWLMLLRNGTIAYGINDVLVRYRVTGNSLSSNKLKSIQQVWEIQTQEENISKPAAFFHVCCFVINGLKKYLI